MCFAFSPIDFLTNSSLVIYVAHKFSNCCLFFHFTFSRVSFNHSISVFLWTSTFEEILWFKVLVYPSKGFKILLVHLSPFRLEFFFATPVRFGSKLFCLYGYEIGREQCVLFSILPVTCHFHSYTVCLGLSLLSHWSVVPVLIPRHPPMALTLGI